MLKLVVKMFFVLGVTTSLFAQEGKDPKATVILDKVSAKFATFKTFQADFVYSIESQATGQNDVIEGGIQVKGDKYVIKTNDGKEIYNNGISIWNFFKEDNEVNIYEYEPGEDNMSPTKMADMYKDGYKYVLKADEDYNGTLCKVVDLEPDLSPEERKYQQIFKIRIFIDPSTYEIKKWKIFEKSGNRYTMEIKKFEGNVGFDDTVFVFDKSKHPGVLVEDMR